MSNERTLPESQGAGGSRPGHGEAQLRAAGRADEGRAVKGAVTAEAARALPGEPPRAGLSAGAGSGCINHNVPGANGQCRESSPGRRTKAQHDEGRTSASGESAGLVFRRGNKWQDHHRPTEGGRRD